MKPKQTRRERKVWVFSPERSRQGFFLPVGKKWPPETMLKLGYVRATLTLSKPRRKAK